MPSGFQVFNDYNALQIDSDFINLALIRKGQVASQNYNEGTVVTTNPTRAYIDIAANEMLAFSCGSAPAAVVFRDGNTVTIAVGAAAGAVINFWVFAPGVTSSTSGMQVFTDTGALAFDSGWKLLNFRGITQGDGAFVFDPGRTYAVMHQNIRTRHVYRSYYEGVSPNVQIIDVDQMYFSGAQVSGANVTASLVLAQQFVQTRSASSPLGPTGEENNNVTSSFLVVDVTGY